MEKKIQTLKFSVWNEQICQNSSIYFFFASDAKFQVPSPLVLTWEIYFVRYCKQHSWDVVDVSLDSLWGNSSSVIRCRRRSSGCRIQKMPNSYSKVTWVEHVEADDRAVHHIYRQLVCTCLIWQKQEVTLLFMLISLRMDWY